MSDVTTPALKLDSALESLNKIIGATEGFSNLAAVAGQHDRTALAIEAICDLVKSHANEALSALNLD